MYWSHVHMGLVARDWECNFAGKRRSGVSFMTI